MRAQGFTLVELLLAAFLAVVLLGVAGAVVSQTLGSVRLHADTQALSEDLRVAAAFIADHVNVAVAVYPPGLTLALGGTDAYTVRNPRTGNGTWVTGQDPILALLLPPSNPSVPCASSTEGCLRFVAFYLLSRADVVARAEGRANPGADPVNDPHARLLYFYSKRLENWPPAASTQAALATLSSDLAFPTQVSGARGFLLADYMTATPPGLQVRYRRCFNEGQPAACVPGRSSLGYAAQEVEVVLSAQRRQASGRDTSSQIYLSASPRNLSLLSR